MFFAQAATTTLTNQTVAVGVLAMILGGIAWIVRQLFSMLPNLMDRLDKQEEKRGEILKSMSSEFRNTARELAERIEKSNDKLGDRMEKAMADIFEDVNDCVEDCLRQIPGNGRTREYIVEEKHEK